MTSPSRFSPAVRDRAVRMVLEPQDKHASQWAAISSIAEKIGCTPETLRSWLRQAERDQDLQAHPERRCPRARRDEVLRERIGQVWRENFEVYGVRKVRRELERRDEKVARCTVARLMGEMGLQGAVRGRKFVRTTIADEAAMRPQDLVTRQFKATAPNQLWVADLTFVATWSGFVYVAFVIDVFARRIVGWRASSSLRSDLALDALEQALHDRPIEESPRLIHHSDRGVQRGFKRSSQHLTGGSCDDDAKAAMFRSIWARQVAIARPTLGGRE